MKWVKGVMVSKGDDGGPSTALLVLVKPPCLYWDLPLLWACPPRPIPRALSCRILLPVQSTRPAMCATTGIGRQR